MNSNLSLSFALKFLLITVVGSLLLVGLLIFEKLLYLKYKFSLIEELFTYCIQEGPCGFL